MRSRLSMLFPLLGVLLAACATGTAATGAPSLATPIATIEPTGTPVATIAVPVATSEPVPAELLGKWRSEFAEGDVAVLTIKEDAFLLERMALANGWLELDDGALLFSHSSLCIGEGRYDWKLSGETLVLESIGTDECDGRSKSLDGVTYIRVE